ncbi:hypothetical protein [Cohnella sp. REN36]|uniref:hypothetical protein n=1 Tax=Cohnella sp. REN36 TaxID=2887347 RepID=UPI001D15114F|nr:hypothetical protein [Cohnella sp. REN36]MCC3371612.1 hypothetical protein [Cohnella sp. REN36]
MTVFYHHYMLETEARERLREIEAAARMAWMRGGSLPRKRVRTVRVRLPLLLFGWGKKL